MKRDELYRNPLEEVADFEFNKEVVAVFPDMIQRSVPGYTTLTQGIGLLAHHFLPNEGLCYDLGCSLGACTQAILDANKTRKITVSAVDSSSDMIQTAQSTIRDPRVQFIVEDILKLAIKECHMIVMNLVLQFIEPSQRVTLLAKLHSALKEDGILVLTEKIPSNTLFETLHLEFKELNGYSKLEIAQKRAALEAVMKLDTLETHLTRLQACGFKQALVWYQCLNWVSILAFK